MQSKGRQSMSLPCGHSAPELQLSRTSRFELECWAMRCILLVTKIVRSPCLMQRAARDKSFSYIAYSPIIGGMHSTMASPESFTHASHSAPAFGSSCASARRTKFAGLRDKSPMHARGYIGLCFSVEDLGICSEEGRVRDGIGVLSRAQRGGSDRQWSRK